MRSSLCVLMLVFCLIALKCTATDDGSQHVVDVNVDAKESGVTTTTTAVQKVPEGSTNNQPQPQPEPVPEAEPEPVLHQPQVVVATTTTTTNKAIDEVPDTHTGAEPEKQEQDSLAPSHGAQNSPAPLPKPEEKAGNQLAKTTTTTTVPAPKRKNNNAAERTTTTVSPTTAISSVQTISSQKQSKLSLSADNKDGSSSTSLLITFAILVTLSVIPIAPAY